jgi:hypothetical protein
MDIKQIREWDENIEDYLKTMGEMSQIYSLLHKRSEKKYSKITSRIDIPTIIISTIAGTLSISSSGLFAGNEKLASVCIGILSLSSSILTTINSYFNFSKRAENHRLVSIQYQRLYLKIDLILGLKPAERPQITDFIRFITDEYNRLSEISPIIDNEIIKKFKHTYGAYKDKISFPNECNGLLPINIYESKPKIIKHILDADKNRRQSEMKELARRASLDEKKFNKKLDSDGLTKQIKSESNIRIPLNKDILSNKDLQMPTNNDFNKNLNNMMKARNVISAVSTINTTNPKNLINEVGHNIQQDLEDRISNKTFSRVSRGLEPFEQSGVEMLREGLKSSFNYLKPTSLLSSSSKDSSKDDYNLKDDNIRIEVQEKNNEDRENNRKNNRENNEEEIEDISSSDITGNINNQELLVMDDDKNSIELQNEDMNKQINKQEQEEL